MLRRETLDFLSKLAKNNNREWFKSHRTLYDEAYANMTDLTMFLIGEIAKFDETVQRVAPGDCLFRIHRDTRFSRDKTPYKTHIGTFIKGGGRRTAGAGYYLQVAPGDSLLAVGIYMPPAAELSAIRNTIADRPDEFKKITGDRTFRSAFGELIGDTLKTVPKGYPRDHPEAELLRYKSYTVMKELSDSAVLDKSFPGSTVRLFMAGKAFNRFLNQALKIKGE